MKLWYFLVLLAVCMLELQAQAISDQEDSNPLQLNQDELTHATEQMFAKAIEQADPRLIDAEEQNIEGQGNLADSEKLSFQNNEGHTDQTDIDSYSFQHANGEGFDNMGLEEEDEQHPMEALVEAIATAQDYDQLSVVNKYVGNGYNLIRGNPEGSFKLGGVDPGIKSTWEIFTHTYAKGKQAYYRGKSMQVPDQISFHAFESCAAKHTTRAYTGRESYMKELQLGVSVSGGYSGLFSFQFSLSAGMRTAEAETQRNKHVVIQKNKICNYGRARYLREYAFAREPGYNVSKSFQSSVEHQLPTYYNKKAYMRFIEDWGTHVIMKVDVGTKQIEKSSASYQEVYKYLKKKYLLSVSAGGSYKGFRGSSSFSADTLNENIDQNTRLGRSMQRFTIGSKNYPQPIHLELMPITEAFSKTWWGDSEWQRSGVYRKREHLARALMEYPRNIGAKINKDPTIKVSRPIARLKILGAAYGKADVTRSLTSRVTSHQTLQVSASNRIFGDPWKGKRKTLVVVYQQEGYAPSIKIAKEHGTLTIYQKQEGDYFSKNRPGTLNILGAAYGPADVTNKVRSLVSGNHLRVAARNSVFGDPWRTKKKTLVVVYQFGNGPYWTKIVTEGYTLRISP